MAHAIPVNAEQNQDAFGVTNYGFQCFDRVYPKFHVYAAAKHFCDVIKSRSDLRFRNWKDVGYRNKFYSTTNDDFVTKFKTSILPILEDGTLYPVESRLIKNSAGEKVKIGPGPDRLVIDVHCNVVGAFSDLDYEINTVEGRVKGCKVLKSIEDKVSPSVSSSNLPRSSSPSRSPFIRSS
ncbi:hypothetical protein EPUL_003459 [Erysiphe pulchra]|uniref:Uncharacterized protein n=1 Tax=Erysiphe pulchra TaxID=225359 RepID=A0A2S4PXR3_9PEZI|nr:hypothetical protein EPUL_003459 [Erysiphe pulchra]